MLSKTSYTLIIMLSVHLFQFSKLGSAQFTEQSSLATLVIAFAIMVAKWQRYLINVHYKKVTIF